MKAEILAVGTELLLGQIVNTNAQYLSVELSQLGIDVYYQTVVGDNPQRLVDALGIAIERNDMVIVTGGLGPTKDDLTKETLADFFHRKLKLDEESLERIRQHFREIGREMTENNIKQAYMPEDSVILKNYNGTAPGCIIEENGKIAIMLPGPPIEMEKMFETGVRPFLQSRSKEKIYSRVIRIFGMGEAMVADQLDDLMSSEDPTLAPYAKEGQVELRVTAKGPSEEELKQKTQDMVKAVQERLGEYIYGFDQQTLPERVVEILKQENKKLTTAESCTGGLIAAAITDIPGSSQVFERGYVTYANEAKEQMIGVSAKTLKSCGAVSSQTAEEMAKGALEAAKADIAVAVTGIAGPGGGTEEKPVGLVYIGIATREKTITRKLNLSGERNKIRRVTVLNALDLVRRCLLESKGGEKHGKREEQQ